MNLPQGFEKMDSETKQQVIQTALMTEVDQLKKDYAQVLGEVVELHRGNTAVIKLEEKIEALANRIKKLENPITTVATPPPSPKSPFLANLFHTIFRKKQ